MGFPPTTAVAGKVEHMVRLRVRIRFCKQGDLRLIGHRDLMRCLERLFRRAGLTLSFSEGFHPKLRMTFPLALAVGIEGVDEVMEVELAERYEADELRRRLTPHAPPGLVFRTIEVLPDGSKKAQVASASYEVPIPRTVRGCLGRADRTFVGFRVMADRTHARPRADRPPPAPPGVGGRPVRVADAACAWIPTAASVRATCWPRSAWPTSNDRESICAERRWRFAHDLLPLQSSLQLLPATNAYWSVLPKKKAAT